MGGSGADNNNNTNNNNNNKNNNDNKTTTTTATKKTITTPPAATRGKQQPQKQEQNKQRPLKKKKLTNNWSRQKETQKRTKNEPNCLQIAQGLKIGPKIAHTPPNAFRLQKQAFQKIKTQNFTKCTKKAFFTHKYSSNWYMHYTVAQCELKNTNLIRAAPRQTGIALSCPVQKFRCVFPQN